MANSNLFYQLYSKSNDKIMAPYVCSSAVDEHDTSFDISDDKAIITDSNGKELASIDLSNIHVNDITQYGVETQILEPNSYYVLEGKYHGEAYATYYYKLPKIVTDTLGYEKYLSMSFDIIYGNWKRECEHCQIVADASQSLPELITNKFNELKIPVNATIQTLQDIKGVNYEYLVFTAETKKYFFYLRNLLVKLCFQSEEYINSPFNNNSTDDVKQIIVDAINVYKPRLNGTYDKNNTPEVITTDDNEDDNNESNISYTTSPSYYNVEDDEEEQTYEIDCNLYTWVLRNYKMIKVQLCKFEHVLEELNRDDLTPEEIIEINKELEYTVFNDPVIQDEYYDYSQLVVIKNMLNSIIESIDTEENYYPKQFWLEEDGSKRITMIKYPNGAYKGIIILSDYPKNEQFEFDSLYVHHIQDVINVYERTHEHDIIQGEEPTIDRNLIEPVYRRKTYGVVSNVDFAKEIEDYSFNEHHKHHHKNCEAINTLSCCYPEYFMPDDLSVGQHQQKRNGDVISMTNYIKYLNDNNLWTKFGHLYTVIGKNDDPQLHTKNFVTSVIVYNPNNIPIRIKYLTFS